MEEQKLSFFDTFIMAMSFTIGAGIITQTGIAIGMIGKSAFIAFFISAALYLISFRPLIMMATIIPRRSAAYYCSKELIGTEFGGFFVYIYFLGRITISIFGISVAAYLASIFPSLANTFIQRAIAVGVVTVFFLANLMGIITVAKLQNIMFFVLLAGLLSFVAFGLGKVQTNFFTPDNFFTNGFF